MGRLHGEHRGIGCPCLALPRAPTSSTCRRDGDLPNCPGLAGVQDGWQLQVRTGPCGDRLISLAQMETGSSSPLGARASRSSVA